MATSFLKKTMVYLGLLDDEYDEYDDYDDHGARSFRGVSVAEPEVEVDEPRTQRPPSQRPPSQRPPSQVGRIRALPRDGSGSSVQPSGISSPSPSVRPMSVSDAAKVQVVAPTRFGDAKEIADCVKSNRPVIVNLQMAERDLQRRMIDFCSGVTYALSGEMERVADQVFLLTPTNVKVSEEERQRLQERGFGRV